jgi:hypothetical protein
VVDVDADQTVRIQAIECDAFRYCHVEIDGAEIAAVGGIRNLMGERIVRLQHESGGKHLLIGWDISLGGGDTMHSLGDVESLVQSVGEGPYRLPFDLLTFPVLVQGDKTGYVGVRCGADGDLHGCGA